MSHDVTSARAVCQRPLVTPDAHRGRGDRSTEHIVRAHRLAGVGQLMGGLAHEMSTPVQYVGDSMRFLKDALLRLQPILQSIATERHASAKPQPLHDVAELLPEDAAAVIDEIPDCLAAALDGIDRIGAAVRVMQSVSVCGTEHEAVVDLNKVVDTAVAASRAEWKYVATIVRNFEPSLPPVICFAGDVLQAFVNLLTNAGQAIAEARRVNGSTPRLGVITVTTRSRANEVDVRVADDGIGMVAAVMQRARQPFFTTKPGSRATGLGLTFVDHVMHRHGGRLVIESTPGSGSAVTITLPLLGIADPVA
jgi:signal transduction histidine kinase